MHSYYLCKSILKCSKSGDYMEIIVTVKKKSFFEHLEMPSLSQTLSSANSWFITVTAVVSIDTLFDLTSYINEVVKN